MPSVTKQIKDQLKDYAMKETFTLKDALKLFERDEDEREEQDADESSYGRYVASCKAAKRPFCTRSQFNDDVADGYDWEAEDEEFRTSQQRGADADEQWALSQGAKNRGLKTSQQRGADADEQWALSHRGRKQYPQTNESVAPKNKKEHAYNMDAAQRQMDAREQQGEDMSNATIDPDTYEIIKNKKTNESFKDFLLSEVSKSTLVSYLDKAGISAVLHGMNTGHHSVRDGEESKTISDNSRRSALNRAKGIRKAGHKLAGK